MKAAQLDLFSLLEPAPAETSPPGFPTLPAQLLAALRIHSALDHERCKGNLAELERQANLILRGVASDRPRLTDERWQAALHSLPYFYSSRLGRNLEPNGIS